MAQNKSFSRSPGWLKAAAGICAPKAPGWLKAAAGISKTAAPTMFGGADPASIWSPTPGQPATTLLPAGSGPFSGTDPAAILSPQPAPAPAPAPAAPAQGNTAAPAQPQAQTPEQLAAAHKEHAQAIRAGRDYVARVEVALMNLSESGFQGGEEELNLEAVRLAQTPEYSVLKEKDLAEAGYVFNAKEQRFTPAGSGEFNAGDRDMAKQMFSQQEKLENAYISGDPKAIAKVERLDAHNFMEDGLKGMNPEDLDKATWNGGQDAMIDYSGGQQRSRTGRSSDLGIMESAGMRFGRMFGSHGEHAKINNRHADDDLKVGDWNGYEEKIRKAHQEATIAGDQETLKWLTPKMNNLGAEKSKFRSKIWADKFMEAHPDYSTPPGYEMPPKPPADKFPEAAAWWDHVAGAREAGAKVPFQWNAEKWGEVPKPIKENWKSFDGMTNNKFTGEVEYAGERRPEHQAIVDRMEAEEKKNYDSSGRSKHDDAAKKYKAEMVDPQQQLLAKYYDTEDPKVREGIMAEWTDRKDYKDLQQRARTAESPEERERLQGQVQEKFNDMRDRGYNQDIYDTAADADRIQVDEWDSKARDARMEYIKDEGLRGAYKTPEDYIETALGKESEHVSEARKRVGERRANSNTLSKVIESYGKSHKEEQAQRKSYEDKAYLAQIEAGNNINPTDLQNQVRASADSFEEQGRKMRIRAHAAASAGNYDEAAELMARKELMFKTGLESAKSGKLGPANMNEDIAMISDDKAWKTHRDEFLADPTHSELAKEYVSGTTQHKEDFTATYSKDVGERLGAMKARVARFDTGRAQELGLAPGNFQPGAADKNPFMAAADAQKPLELPPVGQEDANKFNAERAEKERVAATQPQPGQPQPGQPQPGQPQPGQPVQPPQPGQPQPGQPQKNLLTGMPKPIDGALPEGEVAAQAAANPSQVPVAANQPGLQPAQNPDPNASQDPNQPAPGANPTPQGGNGLLAKVRPAVKPGEAPVGGDPAIPGAQAALPSKDGEVKRLMPERLRKVEDGTGATDAAPGAAPGLPVPTAGAAPAAGAPAPGAPAPGAAPAAGETVKAAPGSLAPSNEAMAGITKPNAPQVGINKNTRAPGNPNSLSGIGTNRVTPDGLNTGQIAKFTTNTKSKSLDTKMFPTNNLKLSDFRGGALRVSPKKLADFRGGTLKGAGYIKNQDTGLEKIPLVGGVLNGMVRGLDDATHFAQRGKYGRAAVGAGQFGLNAGLLAMTAIPVGGVASGAGRLAWAGGRSLIGRAAARQVGQSAFKQIGMQGVNAVKTPIVQTVKSMGSLQGAGNLAKSTLRTGTKWGLPIAGAMATDSGLWQHLGNARIVDGQNNSLLGRLRSNVGSSPPQPNIPTGQKPRSLSILE